MPSTQAQWGDQIAVEAPTRMSGYFGMDESPIDKEGWLHTGDLGRLDDKGNLWIGAEVA